MTRMVEVCIGCLSGVVAGDGGPHADGSAICPKCGVVEAHRIIRRPVTEVDGR